MTPNQALNKVITHELRNGIKPREPPSSPTHSALASKQAKMLKKMVIQESSSDEEEEDAAKSSSSEKEEMDPKLLKQAKIMNKSLKKINMMGYMVFLKDGHHHQLMKVERIKYKKKKPKHEPLSIFGVWVSGGEESSTSSSDESIKRFTTRTNIGASSSNMCLMAKGMESDVNDELEQEVERLMRDLARLKGKSIVQPSQVNRENIVKKLEKGATVTCFKCHQEGHKSYKCPQLKKMISDDKNKKSFTIKSSLIYT
ncbi:hypothetical protein C2845_PM12G10080 [Panicum miliaceum]|uniref:CCHC-type domain-containing protein n=1 Tax=Panicum miliaceum TaxID=4540 RepID=A0A3L6QJ68_PANMI|nr:hypothetical protein C2845_PM12G10080 [Panicum miliaceum]